MAFTVTATESGSSASHGVALLVRVLTNAIESGGASGGSTGGGVTAQGSLTPNFSSSYVAFSVSGDNVTAMPAAAANNTYDLTTGNPSDVWSTAQGHYTGTVTGGTPLTYGAGSAGAQDHANWCAYEIPASGGTITLDGSSPAGVLSGSGLGSGLAATTASFTPPVGSVLVAEVCAGGTGAGAGITVTMTDTSAPSLTWTRRSISSTSDNFQPTYIFTATVPTPSVAGPPPLQTRPGRTWRRRFAPAPPRQKPPLPFPAAPVTVNAGLATGTGAAASPPFPLYIAGLGGTGYNSWFTDQHGQPRLMLSEQAWALPWNAGRWNGSGGGATPQADYTSYFSARSAQGYTAWYGIAWGNTHVDSTALSGGRTWDGIYPLNINGTPGAIATGSETVTLNTTFWSRIDAFFATAGSYGVACFLNLSMSYDISDTGGIWQHATNTQATAFGAALAARYPQSTYPHVFWFWGDDDDGPNDSFYSAMLSGIQGAGDTRALISIEQFTNTNSHIEFDNSTAFSGSFGAPNATYNWVYCYDATYFGVEDSYAEGGTFTHIPPVYGDGVYYGDTGSGTTPNRAIRNFTWWALSSGARGIPSTSGPSDLGGGGLWTWQSGAVGRLTSDPNGTWTTSVIGAIAAYFSGLADWNKLIPDTGNVFITAGRGTRGTCDAPGGVFNFRNTSTYVAGSVTPSGTLAVIYCKASMSITIDQTKMGAGYTATWVDPASLATQSTTTGTTYSSSGLGNNSAGDPDWVLVLQGPASGTATAGLPTGTGTARGAVPAAGVNAVLATGTGAAQSPAAAAGVNAALASGTGAARSPVAAIAVNAALATGAGIAQNATVSTSSSGTANAGLATATGTAQTPATAGSGIFRLMDGVAGRPGNGPGSPSGAGTGNFIAGMLWKVTANGLWLTGYWHWVPAGGDTIPKKFALWQLTDTTHGTSQALVPAGTVTSGTMTAGAWNYVPLPAPIGLSGSVPYCVAVGWVVVNGFPDTQNQFGSGNTYSAGITSGPVFAYSDQGGSATEPYTSNYNQGLFSVASADPAAVMPTTGDVHSNFWVDVQVSYLPPPAATYRLWPSQPYATGWVDDTADNFTLGCEFTLNQPCVLGKLWFYSQPGVTQLPTECGIWNVATQTLVSGTDNASPSWSGAAGSGWVSVSYAGVTLPAGDYKAAVLNAAGSPAIWNPTTNGYWGTGPGAGGVNNGPVGAPDTAHATAPGQDTYNLGASFTYPLTYSAPANGANYWVDVEVTPLTAGLPSGTGTAGQATAAIGVNAVLASGTGAALNATASTSASGTANAVLATGTGAAQSPVAAIGVNAVLAAGTGTAQQPSAATAGSVTAVLPTGAGTALNATVQTSGSTNVTAGLAAGTGTAQSPVPAIAVNAAAATGTGTAQGIGRAATAGLASGTGTAQAPTAVLVAQARAQAAHALAAALNAAIPAQHVPAASAPSVTDPRDGTSSVTARFTSAPSVSSG